MAEKTLSYKDFQKLVGDKFVATTPSGDTLHLTLTSVDLHGEGPEEHRDPFSLHFEDEGHVLVEQQTFSVEHEGLGTHDIFLVPLGPAPHGFRYEAAFG